MPGLVLAVIGGINGLFWLAWGSYALFVVLLGGGIAAFVQMPAAFESGDPVTIVTVLVATMWTPAIQACTGCVDIAFLGAAAAAVLAGVRLRGLRSAGLMRVALLGLIVAPILSMLLGMVAALASFNCCGLLFGQLPTIVLLVINVGVAAWVWTVLSDPRVAEAMSANDGG